MACEAAPRGIAIRHSSASPRHSNLTSALQNTSGNELRPFDPNTGYGASKVGSGRHDSVSMSGLTPQYTSGAMPISMNGSGRQQQRRESNAAGSMMGGGMSWGGISMNSWIHDDIAMTSIAMQGTSPFSGGFKSPSSFHSSSYLPKLEANFMKDFSCCGMVLHSLHDLLGHYEQVHPQMGPVTNVQAMTGATSTASVTSAAPSSQIPQPSTNVAAILAAAAPTSHNTGRDRNQQAQIQNQELQSAAQYQPSQEMDAMEDMEMDDINGTNFDPSMGQENLAGGFPLANGQYVAHTQFVQQGNRVPPLDLNNLANPLQNFQGIRQSQPGTPISAGGRPYHGNPTVSSVNTPTLTAHPRSQQHFKTPDSTPPGTPHELDQDLMGDMGNMSMDTPGFMTMPQTDMASYGYGNDGGDLGEIYINEPAKRLFNPNGGPQDQQSVHHRLSSAQYGADSDIAKQIRERQRRVGLPDTLEGDEPKPFRCPVIGCEKAYKNQNGLKYHKNHGHKKQQLQDNQDGSYSIVDPNTHAPYPGTEGMEKEKPYVCKNCGKRYKNLNGLKYHRNHSPPCYQHYGQTLQTDASMPVTNVTGAGLSQIGEEK